MANPQGNQQGGLSQAPAPGAGAGAGAGQPAVEAGGFPYCRRLLSKGERKHEICGAPRYQNSPYCNRHTKNSSNDSQPADEFELPASSPAKRDMRKFMAEKPFLFGYTLSELKERACWMMCACSIAYGILFLAILFLVVYATPARPSGTA